MEQRLCNCEGIIADLSAARFVSIGCDIKGQWKHMLPI